MNEKDFYELPNTIECLSSKAPRLKPLRYAENESLFCCINKEHQLKNYCCDKKLPVKTPIERRCTTNHIQILKTSRPKAPHNKRDILHRQIRWRCIKPPIIPAKEAISTLGSPIGVATSSFSIKFLHSKEEEIYILGFATCLIAFAELYITPECEWDSRIINRILMEGQRLLAESTEIASKASTENTDLVLTEDLVQKTFVLCGNTFRLELLDAFAFGLVEQQMIDDDCRIPRLHTALLEFFKSFKICLAHIGSWYVLIWKNEGVFFVFDCFGRRLEDFGSDHRKNGLAVLLCLRNIENVAHLLLNLSLLQADDFFSLRMIKVEDLIACGGNVSNMISHERKNHFDVVNADYALLKASKYLGSDCFVETRFRHSLPIAIIALIYSKIDPPAAWTPGILDQILFFGNKFYKEWTRSDFSLELNITDVPHQFLFSEYNVAITICVSKYLGPWKCTPNYRQNELCFALHKSFKAGDNNIVVNIGNRNYAVWKRRNYYYIFDPYAHMCLEFMSSKSQRLNRASLRMCRTVDMLCCIFTQVILEINTAREFIMHIVRIKIEKAKQSKAKTNSKCMPMPECLSETESLNESVYWDHDEFKCKVPEDEGAVGSDYEEFILDLPGMSQTDLELNLDDFDRDLLEEEVSEKNIESDEEEEDANSFSADNKAKKHSKFELTSSDDEDGTGGIAGGKGKESKKNADKTKERSTSDQKKDKDRDASEKGVKNSSTPSTRRRGDESDFDNDDFDSSYDKNGNKKKSKRYKTKSIHDKDKRKQSQIETNEISKQYSDKEITERKQSKDETDHISKGPSNEDIIDNNKKKQSNAETDQILKGHSDKDITDTDKTKQSEAETNQISKVPSDKLSKEASEATVKDTIKKSKDKPDQISKDAADRQSKEARKSSEKPQDSIKDYQEATEITSVDKSGQPLESSSEGKPDIRATTRDRSNEAFEESDDISATTRDRSNAAFEESDDSRKQSKKIPSSKGDTKSIMSSIEQNMSDESGVFEDEPQLGEQRAADEPDNHEKSQVQDREPGQQRPRRRGSMADGSDSKHQGTPAACLPNSYPGLASQAYDLAVVGSENGSYESLCSLIRVGFKCADRILTMTPWGNYVVFRQVDSQRIYFVFDGCTCNVNRFRHLDLSIGTAGLLCFITIHDLIKYIIDGKRSRTCVKSNRKNVIDDICKQYCH